MSMPTPPPTPIPILDLNNKTLRTILAAIFNVTEDYIILKQGNWFNPQSMLPTASKPLTWIAYKILDNVPVTIPYNAGFNEDIYGGTNPQWVNYIEVPKMARVQLQFVGTMAEELANSMIFWLKRSDVLTQFYTVRGAVMADEFRVISSDFYQDGNNNIIAFNVQFRVLWLQTLLTNQEVVTSVTIADGTIS